MNAKEGLSKQYQKKTSSIELRSERNISDEVESLPRKLHVDIPSQVRLEVTTHL